MSRARGRWLPNPGRGRSRQRWFGIALCLLVAAACGRQRAGRDEEAGVEDDAGRGSAPASATEGESVRPPPGAGRGPTHTEMSNVDLRVMEGATLHVRRLVGEATSVRPGEPVALDDKTSYTIDVESAEVMIGYEDLSRVMNDYTLAFKGAPVKALAIAREEDEGEEDQVQLTGRLKKALGVPFEIEGRPEVTPDGRIRIRTTSIQALDIKVGGLLHALGLEPKDLLGNLEERGLSVDGDDMILDASRAMPPPRIAGRVTTVQVGAQALTLRFGSATPRGGRAASGRSNYLWFRSGTIRIGKMTQRDADLRIVDEDPRDPLDFYPDHMTQQLVAGYAKLGANGGLTLFVPDYEDLR